ncbi:MAG: 3-hydroxyacyl-CoA dehydrogenase NAD-binding domain-containing protein [Gammaproteobacteria bacterium]|nr:3-hydroxyacyl-CoA dehydrogenase NAD-binding domain-containing protein [Gammaproteobacteria bacterium]
MAKKKYKNWNITNDEHGIAWLHLDVPKSSANILNEQVILELDSIVNDLSADEPTGVVILSDKESGFIAGADINEFTTFESEEAALQNIQRAHSIFNHIENLSCPTVALIHGFCLGGGMELALACKYRIAEEDSSRLGLPEVKLGIHPGFGGTVRSIERMGSFSALDLMLTGRNLKARQAFKTGLINYSVPKRHLMTAATQTILNRPKIKSLPWWENVVNHKLIRPFVAKMLVKKVSARAAKSHYPAPYAIIDLWSKHLNNRSTMLEEEAKSIAHLLVGKTAQNLIRVFKLTDTLKGLAKDKSVSIDHIHVIGGGVMGGDIAIWCALQGFNVTLQDQRHETLAAVIQRAAKLYTRLLKDKRLVNSALDHLTADINGNGLTKADVVIEAIFEDAEVKRNLYKAIEPRLKKTAIIATNTSSIPLEQLTDSLNKPDRLVGLHFFNPVAKMPLVEIVVGEKTSKKAQQIATTLTKKIRKLPLPVTSTPGFLVNRILMPYLTEAVTLFEEGVPITVIDKIALEFGMPMGPIELADTVGLDICLHVAENLAESMPITVSEHLKQLVSKKILGKKTGQGFYAFKKGKLVKPKMKSNYIAPPDIENRLILRLINETMACLREHVAETRDLIDAGIIFGTGFAPFHGGPLQYVKERGQDEVLKALEHLEINYGSRFKPDSGWKTIKIE